MTSTYIFDQKPALEDLTHYGVKGMKWGVRKDRVGKSERAPLTDKQKSRRAKASFYIGTGSGLFIASKFAESQGVPLAMLNGLLTWVGVTHNLNNFLQKRGGKKIKDIEKDAKLNKELKELEKLEKLEIENPEEYNKVMREHAKMNGDVWPD